MTARSRLAKVVDQFQINTSDDWLQQAIPLFVMCMGSSGAAVEWHDEVGGLNFSAGLSIADANDVLAALRDSVLELVWDASREGDILAESLPDVVKIVLTAFDRALAAQASAYIRESQRHLSGVNRNLEYRQRMFERDLALAKLVQQQFIPKSFETENFQAEVRYVPTTEIGGDHAGIFPISPDRIYLTICDVTGHGIASALVAEVVSTHLRPLLRQRLDTTFEYEVEPVDIVRHLNTLFYNEFQPLGILLTFLIVLIDCKAETITYSGAGHPPAILQCCSAHNFIELRSQNFILGAVEDCIVDEGQDTLPIHRGDRVIFYTDGIIEANDGHGNMLGLDGLETILQKHYESSQGALADEILNSARQIVGSNESDDMSLILLDVLKRT